MNATRFDRIAALFAERRLSRRKAIRQGGAGLAAGALMTAALSVPVAVAQDSAPAAGPAKSENDPSFMFVQSFQSGSFAPKSSNDGTFTLTLDHGLGQTVFFSDRPERIVGANPTATFLERFPFGADNPPNAALVLEAGPDDTDVVVLELTAPAYEEATHTATYDAKVLTDYEKLGITFQEQPKGAAALHPQFGAASLFIDDCPDGNVGCYDPVNRLWGIIYSVGYCWDWGNACCAPCDQQGLIDQCNVTYPGDMCGGACHLGYGDGDWHCSS
jgi:hypothetical protein